ncbi:MAG: DNA polymerase III subunit delta [Planctomycetaceae bacterium]
MRATEFLKSPEKEPIAPVVAIFGEDRWLKSASRRLVQKVVLGDDDEAGPTRFTGKDADFKAVCDELLTVSMWSPKRLVVIEDADEFVSKFRAELEKYVKKPAKKSVLVLDVKTWPKTTRLAKMVAESGLGIDCQALNGPELGAWLQSLARDEFGKTFRKDALALIVELAGSELGLLEQEVAKLASFAGDRAEITAEDVRTLVGGWSAETTFAMTRELQSGRLGEALSHLDKLLASGEAPQKILGGIHFVYRRLIRAAEAARGSSNLQQALRQSGVFPGEVAVSERYLRALGRSRVDDFCRLLLEADGNLKGNSRVPERIQLEQLLTALSGKV